MWGWPLFCSTNSIQIPFCARGIGLSRKWLPISAEPLSYCLYHSIIWTFLADLLTWWQFDSLFGIPRSATGHKGAKP